MVRRRAGRRTPFTGDLPERAYRACWFRGWEPPHGWARVWNLRDPLPRIRIPLKRPDADVELDLAHAPALADERNRFDRVVDYSIPPVPPLSPTDAEWEAAPARKT
ncbi:MAG: DUF4058 family protein [Planctomycetes bacterium]|nr:DUF4058 family protein [Planctomycetota bacterium]